MERTLKMSGQGLGLGRVGRNRVLMMKVLGIDGMAEAITTRSSRVGDRGRGGGGGRKTGRPVRWTSDSLQLHFIVFYFPCLEFQHTT